MIVERREMTHSIRFETIILGNKKFPIFVSDYLKSQKDSCLPFG